MSYKKSVKIGKHTIKIGDYLIPDYASIENQQRIDIGYINIRKITQQLNKITAIEVNSDNDEITYFCIKYNHQNIYLTMNQIKQFITNYNPLSFIFGEKNHNIINIE